MPQLDAERLFTILTRHSIYVEAVKSAQDYLITDAQANLKKSIVAILNDVSYSSYDQMTKAELTKLVATIRAAQNAEYNDYVNRLIGMLNDFMKCDLYVQRAIMTVPTLTPDGEDEPQIDDPDYDEVTGDQSDNDKAASFFWRSLIAAGLASQANTGPLGGYGPSSPYSATGKGNAALWRNLKNAINPADGQSIEDLIDTLTANNQLGIIKELKKAYVNGSTKDELNDIIFGTKENGYTDGLLAKQARQMQSVQHTVMQQVTINISQGVQSKFFDCYQWVAVLDNRTSEICLHLNGRVFQYGNGPLPPAHYRCRSKIVPAPGCEGFEQPDVGTWFNDNAGDAADYGDFESGKFAVTNPLSIEDFLLKINDILAD